MTQDLKKEAERQAIIDTCTRLAIERIQFRQFHSRRTYIPPKPFTRKVLEGHILHALKWGYGHATRY